MGVDKEFDFDPNDIARTMLQAELDVRSANNWADARVAIANSQAKAAMVVSLLALFLAGASGMALLTSVGQNATPVQVNLRQPN
jgi:hypothetical protein